MANSALERVLAAVNNGQRGNSSDLSGFVSNYAKTSREALEKQRKQNEESVLRGQQIIEAQKARDIINKAASNTAATYDFAHGQLPSINNAQAFQNTQRQTSLDDSLNQIMGNNVLTDAGRVSKAQEAFGSLLSAPTVSSTPTAREVANAYRQSYANINTPIQKAAQAVEAYKEEREKVWEEARKKQAEDIGSQRNVGALTRELNRKKQENSQKAWELSLEMQNAGSVERVNEIQKQIDALNESTNRTQQQLDNAIAAQDYLLRYNDNFAENARYDENIIGGLPKTTGGNNTAALYQFINGRYQAKEGDPALDMWRIYTYLDDNERGTFNYLLKTEGAERADEYLQRLQPELEARNAQAISKRAYEYGRTNPWKAAAGTVAFSPLRTLGALGTAYDELVNGKVNENAWYNTQSQVLGSARSGALDTFGESVTNSGVVQGIANSRPVSYFAERVLDQSPKEVAENVGKVAKFLGSGTLSHLDSLWNGFLMQNISALQGGMNWGDAQKIYQLEKDNPGLISSINPEAADRAKKIVTGAEELTRAVMGAEVVSDAVREAKERGLSDEQAFELGMVAGAAEYITEKWSIGDLFESDWTKPTLTKMLTHGGSEFSEEIMSSLINEIADISVSGEKSQFRQDFNEYKKNGASDGKAFAHTLLDHALEAGKEGLSAFLTTGVSVGLTSVQQNIHNPQTIHNKVSSADSKSGGNVGATVDGMLADLINRPDTEWSSGLADIANQFRGKVRGNTMNSVRDYIRETARNQADAVDKAAYTALADYLTPYTNQDGKKVDNRNAVWQLAEERNGTAKQTAQTAQNTQTETAPEQTAPSTETAEPSSEPSTETPAPSTESSTATETEPVRQATARERREEARRQKRIAQIQNQLDRNPNASVDAQTMALQDELRILQEESERFTDSLEGYEGDSEADERTEPLSWAERHRQLRHSDQAADQQTQTEQNQTQTQAAPQNVSQTSENAPVTENGVETENNTVAENEAQRGSTEATEDALQNEPGYRPSERRIGASALSLSEDLSPEDAAVEILKRIGRNTRDVTSLMQRGVTKTAIDALNRTVDNAIQNGQYTEEEVDALKSYTDKVRDALRNNNTTLQKKVNALSYGLKRLGIENVVVDETMTTERGKHKGNTIYISPYLDTMQSIASVVAHEAFHQARDGNRKNAKLLDDIDKYYSTLASRAQDEVDDEGNVRTDTNGNPIQFSISDTGGKVRLYSDADFVRTYADMLMDDFGLTDEGYEALNAYGAEHKDADIKEAVAAVFESDPEKFWSYWKESADGETAHDYIREEKAANFIEQLAGTDGGALFNELVRDDRNLAQRIIDAIRSFLKLPAKERRFEGAEAYQRLADKFEKALADATGAERQHADMRAATANDIPQSDSFKMSRTVERVGDLIAVHNLTEDKYLSSHKLGGFPAPSIAVVKAKTGHSDYGDISVVFSSDTIDPQKDSRNKIFGGDAWTPMFPDTEYDYDKTGIQNLDAAIHKLASSLKVPGVDSRNAVEQVINDSKRWSDTSIDSVVRILSANRTVQAAYLAANGGTLKAKNHFDAYDELDKKVPEISDVAKWIRPAVEFISDNGSVTVSGKRVPLTAENVVRAMYDNQGSRGVDIYEADANGLRSMAAPEFRSIDEVRQNKNLLERLPEQEYRKIINRMDGYISSIMDEMREFNGDRPGLDYDGAILNALREGGTEEDIRYTFEEAGIGINDKLVRDVGVLYRLASQLPTDYFEAKPERVVGFDEVMYYIVPDQTSEEVIRMMKADGAKVRTYAEGNEKDRLKVLNSLKDVRFSREMGDIEQRVEDGEAISAVDEVRASRELDEKYMEKAVDVNRRTDEDKPEQFVDDAVMEQAGKDRATIKAALEEAAKKVHLPEDITGNTYIANGSYNGTEENTTICIRSLALDALCDAVAEKIGRPLTVEESVFVSQSAFNWTQMPQCMYCYVSMDRMAKRQYLLAYIEKRNQVIADLRSGMTRDEAFAAYKKREQPKGKWKDDGPKTDRFNRWVDNYENKARVVTMSDLASEKAAERALADPVIHDEAYDALDYAQHASWAKKRIGYTAYNNHILNWKQDRIDALNSMFGLRMYSFSDYSPAFVLENMQMITDAAVRGLKMLAYTKDLDFVKIFAPTGMNINISVFSMNQRDADGNFAEDAMQGANWKQAQALRDQYPGVGITYVATNDEQVEWALDQDWIDVIIPFHMVKTGAEVAGIMGYNNYTGESSDRTKKGNKKAEILPNEHQNDKETYMNLIRERNLKPRFSRWQNHPNYMKLVNETRRSAGDTPSVQPVFEVGEAEKSIDKMVRQGGYNVPIGGSLERMNQIAQNIGGKIEKGFAENISIKDGIIYQNGQAIHPDMELPDTEEDDVRESREINTEQTETDAFKNWFGDSKVVDDNGNPLVVHHGTTADFTQFRPQRRATGSHPYYYFSENSEYPKRFMKAWGNAETAKYMDVYLSISNPLDLSGKKKPISEWKTILSDAGVNLDEGYFDSVREGYGDSVYGWQLFRSDDGTFQDAVRDSGYDGIKTTESSGDTTWVAFDPTQIKSATDNIGTFDRNNPDVRYSKELESIPESDSFRMSREVERVGDLVAVHNLTGDQLERQIEIGGFAAPSIAVIKAKGGHTNYGDFSVVFGVDSIDPQKNKKNKIYGGDAYTPTFPEVGYDIDDKKLSALNRRIDDILGDESKQGLHIPLYEDHISSLLTSNDGDFAQGFADNTQMKYAFLKDTGRVKSLPKKTKQYISRYTNDELREFANAFDVNALNEGGYSAMMEAEPQIRKFMHDLYERKYDKRVADALYTDKAMGFSVIDKIVNATMRLMSEGEVQETDTTTLPDVVSEAFKDESVAKEYTEWLNNLSEGLVKGKGVRNNKDKYTSSGNRRTFRQLYDDFTLENIVKAMYADKTSRGVGTWGVSSTSLQSVTTPSYRNLNQVRKDSSRLGRVSEEEYQALERGLNDRLSDVRNKIYESSKNKSSNSFVDNDYIAQAIIQAARGSRTTTGIIQSMARDGYTITEDIAKELQDIYNESANLPTEYFEAKPERVMGLDEIAYVIAPDNMKQSLRTALNDANINVVEYESGNEEDRLAKLNSLEDVRFSREITPEQDAEYMEAAKNADNAIEFWMNLSEEQQKQVGKNYKNLYEKLKKSAGEKPEWVTPKGNKADMPMTLNKPDKDLEVKVANYTDKSKTADADVDGIITLNKANTDTWSDYAFMHEIGHQIATLGILDNVISNPGGLFGRYNQKRNLFEDTLGFAQKNPDEAFSDAYAYYRLYPETLKERSPDVYAYFEKLTSENPWVNNWADKAFDKCVQIARENNVDIRYSRAVTPEMDEEYMDAVESGDEETQNRIIEEAAKAAGYNYRGYHGTNRKFTTFIPGYATGWGKGIYVASNMEDAENYGSNVMPVYLKMENPYTGQKINAENTQAYKKYVEDYYKKIARNEDITVEEAMQDRQKPTVMDMVNDEDVNYLNAALRELGYDGIIMDGSNDITGTEMVVFDPSQVKSADPVTYDDDGNVIPPSQRFNPDSDDIRESRDIETASNADLRRMLRESEEKIDYLKKQWTSRTAFGAAQAVKPEDFNKQVRRLKDMMKYSVVTTDEIRKGLRELYDIMERPLKGRNDTAEARWNEAAAKAEELANEWASAAAVERVINPDISENFETLKDIYAKLRGYNGFYIKPEMTAEAGDKESFRKLRRQLAFMHLLGVDSNKAGVESGRMSIDAIYTDLARSYPGFFEEQSELSGGELNGDYAKLQAIADVAGFAWEAVHDPYSVEQTIDEQTVKTQLKDDLLHSFFDVAVPTKASSRPTENDAREAYAQGQAELGAVAESEREEGYREGYNKAKFEDEGAVEAAHMREDLMEQRFADDAERFKNTMRKMLNEREEKIDRLEKRLIRRGWMDRARVERNGVMRNLNKLNRLLENPTRKQHIPQGLRASTAKLLESVGNTRLPNGKTVLTDRMQQIQADEMKKMRDFAHEIQIGLTGVASAENSNRIASTEGFLLQLADKINALEDYYNRAVGPDVDMSLRTDDVAVTQNYGFLHSLNQILTMAVHALDDANQFTIQGKNYTAENLGSLLVGDLNGRESEGYGRQKRKFAANLSDKLRDMTYETMSADLFFGMMGDNWKNIVAHSYREGQNRQAQHEHQFVEYMKELLGDYDNMNAKRELIQINANGKPLNVTRSQLMQLYATYQRPAGRTHLENGGACFVDDRGNESRAYTVKITPEKFAELTSHLTEEDKRIADGLVKFMADECSEWGNDASMYMYGFRMYEDGSYIPLDVVNYAIPKEIADKIQKTKSIENASFTNPLKRNSTVPLRMTDIFDITNNHVRRMAAYNAYAPITNDMNRIMKLSDVSGTVQEKMGRRGYKYLQDFVQTVAANEVRNGEMAESAAPLTTAMNLYKRQAVAWNVSTMLKQPISIFRAANEIDGKYLRQGFAMNRDEYQRIRDTMLANSGVAYLKDNGYSDVGLGKTMEKLYTKNYINDAGLLRSSLADSKLGRAAITAYDWMTDKGMAGAGRADEATWVRIWKACELEVAEKHPGITADEKLRLVTQRFNDVIGKTQVVDTILDTAPLMRNKAMQIFTPFMNEPTKSLGGLVAAADAARNGRTGAKKALHKAIGLYALSNLLIEPLITSLVSMWRDEKDDTDGFLWSLLEKMFGIKRDEDGDGKNDTTFGSVFTSNVAKGFFSFPLLNIAYDTISNAIQGFGSEKIDVAALSNLVSSSIALGSNMAKEPDERPKTMYRLWGDWIESAAAAMGIPLKTMRRQVAGTLRGVMDITNSDWAKWQYNKLYYNLENGTARSQKNFYDILASAYKRGDTETYERMRKELNDIVTGSSTLVDSKTIVQNIERRGGNVQPGDPLWNVEVQARFRLDTPVKGWKNENFLTGVYKQAESAGIKQSECEKVLYSMPDNETKDEDGEKIKMTPAQYDQFTSDCGDLAYKLVSQLSSASNAKAWSALTIDQQLYAIEKVYDYSKRKFRKDINPNLDISGMGKDLAAVYETAPMDTSKIVSTVMEMAKKYDKKKDRKKK